MTTYKSQIITQEAAVCNVQAAASCVTTPSVTEFSVFLRIEAIFEHTESF
jgi:hypothetical protein